MLDLIAHHGWWIGVVFDPIVVGAQLVDGYRKDFFIDAMFIFHQEGADRSAAKYL